MNKRGGALALLAAAGEMKISSKKGKSGNGGKKRKDNTVGSARNVKQKNTTKSSATAAAAGVADVVLLDEDVETEPPCWACNRGWINAGIAIQCEVSIVSSSLVNTSRSEEKYLSA